MTIACLLAIGTLIAAISVIVTVWSLFSVEDRIQEHLQYGYTKQEQLVKSSQKLTQRVLILVAVIIIFFLLFIFLPHITH